MTLASLLAVTYTWDPFIRGILIVAVAVLVLPGSVYFVLSTNVGTRMGFLLTAAAASGWLLVLTIVWAIFGIGPQGRAPSWSAEEVITGSILEQNTITNLNSFPGGKGWKKLPLAKAGDPAAAADGTLVPPAPKEGQTPKKPKTNFTSPFRSTSDYVLIDAYEKGKDDGVIFTLHHHKFYRPFRPPHYVVLVEQPVVPSTTAAVGGAPTKPVADMTKPATYVVLVRNLGSIRQPPLFIGTFALIVFVTVTYSLHRRDLELIRERQGAAVTA
ncbi:MAG: hypothetical protein QOG64_1045 [Acidimicrobiaceae bacterium]|nr:hypothetical protein [Acidimicrobiaceae bacterium]